MIRHRAMSEECRLSWTCFWEPECLMSRTLWAGSYGQNEYNGLIYYNVTYKDTFSYPKYDFPSKTLGKSKDWWEDSLIEIRIPLQLICSICHGPRPGQHLTLSELWRVVDLCLYQSVCVVTIQCRRKLIKHVFLISSPDRFYPRYSSRLLLIPLGLSASPCPKWRTCSQSWLQLNQKMLTKAKRKTRGYCFFGSLTLWGNHIENSLG